MLHYVSNGLAVTLLVVASGPSVKTHTTERKSACGPGTISFRAPPAKERHFTCAEGSWYDGGYRLYRARLRAPVGSARVTLVLVHSQTAYNGGGSGELLTKVVRVRAPKARALAGRIDFSIVYATPAPAGAPPYGTYTLTIYRGATERGQVLARGTFIVIED